MWKFVLYVLPVHKQIVLMALGHKRPKDYPVTTDIIKNLKQNRRRTKSYLWKSSIKRIELLLLLLLLSRLIAKFKRKFTVLQTEYAEVNGGLLLFLFHSLFSRDPRTKSHLKWTSKQVKNWNRSNKVGTFSAWLFECCLFVYAQNLNTLSLKYAYTFTIMLNNNNNNKQ